VLSPLLAKEPRRADPRAHDGQMAATSSSPDRVQSPRTRNRKLSSQDREEIVALAHDGWSGVELAHRFDVDRSRITRLLSERGVSRGRYPAPPVGEQERKQILFLCRCEPSVDAVVAELRRRGTPRAQSTVYKVVQQALEATTAEPAI
jgi:transposase-like protein